MLKLGQVLPSNRRAKLTIQADSDRRRDTGMDIALAAQSPAQGSYTAKQGQYLAFIYYYTKIHGCSPSEADMQRYFRVSPPAVHQMVLTLEVQGFIERTPGLGRSVRLLLPREKLPDLM